jgi:hypothetical protein
MRIETIKPTFVIFHGKSVEELERRIDQYKDLDVYWASISTFDIPQQYILDKIGRKFDLVYDSSTVENEVKYELEVRIPRLEKYFNESHGYYICTKSDRNNLYDLRNRIVPEFNEKYKDRILYVEDIGINPNEFCVSIHLFLCCLIKLGLEKIVLFGADGGGSFGNNVDSYYKSELVKKDKKIANGGAYNMIGDTNNVNGTYAQIMNKIIGYVPSIYNCSPGTKYTIFENIFYDDIVNMIK